MLEKSVRNRKITNLIRNELINVIHREVGDPRLINPTFISIFRLELSKDYRNATVYVSMLDINKVTDDRKKEIILVLNTASNYMSHLLLKRLHIKTVPKLLFRYDSGVDNMMYVENVSKEIAQQKKYKS